MQALFFTIPLPHRQIMSQKALTHKYRPQAFADVAGQETARAILSRAALEDRVAPAYLFSGTRGVGKTTLARIFAKALNCREAPTAEPCNKCDLCRAVTMGTAVDVVEIDGASNRGIDDVRKLKEVVGYAPMDGRYRVFIIDEAHMLSREAFNALLKTLEEPPAGVTFILATTEAHKFPATIISRCQHFVFKRLSENGLVEHLSLVLSREGIPFEESAVRLIARRGAGSVRDSMSLLSQVLALGEGGLTEASARSVLGLAGQEAFRQLLAAFADGDSLTLARSLREMLDQGLDMGFFLRELSSMWRNLFILKQSGEAALGVADLPENDARALLAAAEDFSLTHIHACWQMTLEGQRRVLTSLEPALALELLLLNLAMLPELLNLEHPAARSVKRAPSRPPDNAGGSAAPPSGGALPPRSGGSTQASPAQEPLAPRGLAPAPAADLENAPGFEPDPEPAPLADAPAVSAIAELPIHPAPEPAPPSAPEAAPEPAPAPAAFQSVEAAPREPEAPASADSVAAPLARPAWEAVLAACEAREFPAWFLSLCRNAKAQWEDQGITVKVQDRFTAERLLDPAARSMLESVLLDLCGTSPRLSVPLPENTRKDRDTLRRELLDNDLVQTLEKTFEASIVDFGQIS